VAIPERIENPQLRDYLAVISQAIFQAGLSWALIAAKWEAYRRLFAEFDVPTVAAFGEADVERILADGGVVRTRKKIVATIENAKRLLALDRAFAPDGPPGAGVRAYLRSFADYDALANDLKTRFAFLGDLSAYYVLFRVGEPVPRFEAWETTIKGDHPRMREMIAHARAGGWPG
jgi:DNA-3-methyladenine glycosylase I